MSSTPEITNLLKFNRNEYISSVTFDEKWYLEDQTDGNTNNKKEKWHDKVGERDAEPRRVVY